MAKDKMRRFKVRGDNEKAYQHAKGRRFRYRTSRRSNHSNSRFVDRIKDEFRQEP